jgi:hypothetical protein
MWHGLFGLEGFGRPVSPWAALLTPVPVGAFLLMVVRLFALPQHTWPWLADRLGEAAWVVWGGFAFATVGQAIAMAWSNRVWRETEGEKHLDYSPRGWHYVVGVLVAMLPIAGLQLSSKVLNAYLRVSWQLQSWVFPGQPVHAGYDPDLGNLLVVGVLPVVLWQARGVVARIPCGRLLGFQRELARLKGAVAWDAKAWGEAVGETFERWMADVHPIGAGAKRERQHRLRWMHFTREVVAAYQAQPADLARANRALATYRQGL